MLLTSNPDLAIFSTSVSFVNKVATELKDKPSTIANEMPINNPVWRKRNGKWIKSYSFSKTKDTFVKRRISRRTFILQFHP